MNVSNICIYIYVYIYIYMYICVYIYIYVSLSIYGEPCSEPMRLDSDFSGGGGGASGSPSEDLAEDVRQRVQLVIEAKEDELIGGAGCQGLAWGTSKLVRLQTFWVALFHY